MLGCMRETCRRRIDEGLALPRMSDVGMANFRNLSDADTPFTFARPPGADSPTGDSTGLGPEERPQVCIQPWSRAGLTTYHTCVVSIV